MNVRSEFPFFSGEDVPVYLDNAATTQKPRCVLEAIREYYTAMNANVHRGAHRISRLATEAHEAARAFVADFLHAATPREILFTSGCTEGINLVAGILSSRIVSGDEILVSTDSHHSNIVPWQFLCERVGARLIPVPLTEDLLFDYDAYLHLLNEKTRVVSVPMVSNALGLRLPVEEIIRSAHGAGALVCIDGAQAVAHEPIDVQALECDFFTFSGHKVYAPTGTGVLWGREELLDQLPPWKGGGEMISQVSFEHTSFNSLPFKYEAGTPNIAGNIVLADALKYILHLGLDTIRLHEHTLFQLLCEGLSEMKNIRILGKHKGTGSLLSIHIPDVHHYDLGMLLDQMNIAVRTGHHCCQPLMHALGITGTTRFSIALYSNEEDIIRTVRAVRKALEILHR